MGNCLSTNRSDSNSDSSFDEQERYQKELCAILEKYDVKTSINENNKISKNTKFFLQSILKNIDLEKRVLLNGQKNIEELFLHDCNLEEFPEDVIIDLGQLTKLWLSHNKLTELPKNIQQLSCIKSIWLNQNLFEDIPNLPHEVENVYLQENTKLYKLDNIGLYTNIKELYLHECLITVIPNCITNLINVQCIHLHGNVITELNPNLFKLSNLQKLYLHSNSIIEIPKEVNQCSSLWFLSLHYNQLTELPEEFGELQSLQRLSLHHNMLNSLPKSFGKLSTHLKALSLFSNELETLDQEVVKGLSNQCDNLAIFDNRFPDNMDFSILSGIKNLKI